MAIIREIIRAVLTVGAAVLVLGVAAALLWVSWHYPIRAGVAGFIASVAFFLWLEFRP
jgi:TRAP-type C4-dicarboxylate transport system permease small subunit